MDIQSATGKKPEVRERNHWNVQQREKKERTRSGKINRPRWNKNNRAGRRPKEDYSAGLTQRKKKGIGMRREAGLGSTEEIDKENGGVITGATEEQKEEIKNQ